MQVLAARTRIVMRVLDDLCTTRRREIIRLTTIPTSTFQMIEHRNVSDMSVRSTHALILHREDKLVCDPTHYGIESDELPVIMQVMRRFRQ